MSVRFRQRLRGRNRFSDGEDINPMNYTGNLSDAMLVLAVGIMLALVMAFHVNLSPDTQNADTAAPDTEKIAQTPEPLQSSEEEDTELEQDDLEEYGVVYRDKDGNLYVIENR